MDRSLNPPVHPVERNRRGPAWLAFGFGISSGLLLWGSFFIPILAWIALAPLGLLIRWQGGRASIYLGAFLGGIVLFSLGTYWICYCAPLVWVGWMFLVAYLALYFPAFVLITRMGQRHLRLPMIFSMPLVWVALEYVRMHLLSGFGWLMLAHSIHSWEWAIQSADLAGVYGVSFIVATFNALLVELLTLPLFVASTLNPALRWRAAWAVSIVCLNVGYAQYRIDTTPTIEGPRCLMIQTNLAQDIRNTDNDAAFEYMVQLTKSLVGKKADIVIWPEGTYPYSYGRIDPGLTDLEVSDRYTRRITAPGHPVSTAPTEENGKDIRKEFAAAQKDFDGMVAALKMPMLMGGPFWDINIRQATLVNASILQTPDGAIDVYGKVHTLPFGEYVPLRGYIPFYEYFNPYPSDMNYDTDAGEKLSSLHAEKLNLAPLICFEDTIPDLAREYLRQATPDKPVEILVNQSNDGWFRNSIEGSYHLAASIFRCVEVRRPMVRSSNTGPSNLVDSCGRVLRTFEKDGRSQGVDGDMTVDVPLDDRASPYVIVGDWLPWIGLIFSGTSVLAGIGHIARTARKSCRTTP